MKQRMSRKILAIKMKNRVAFIFGIILSLTMMIVYCAGTYQIASALSLQCIEYSEIEPHYVGETFNKNKIKSTAKYYDSDEQKDVSESVKFYTDGFDTSQAGTTIVWGSYTEGDTICEEECRLTVVERPESSYAVAYEVVNGTWIDGTDDPIVEVVMEGQNPSRIPTGMKPADGYEGGSWNTDPTTASITGDTKFTYTFTKKPAPPVKISAPTAKTLTYNGKSQTGVTAGEGYTLSGTTSATNAGSYQATATLKEGYVWSDGKTEPKTIPWKINKAANPLTIKAKTATVKGSTKGKNGKLKKTKTLAVSKVIAFTKKGQGKMTYTKSSGSKKITINKTTGKVTVKKGLKKGTYKVKVKVKAAGNANYKASAWKTVTFKVKVK